MKLIKFITLFPCTILCAQTPCTLEDLLKDHLLTDAKYYNSSEDINLSHLFFEEGGGAEYIGYIGKNKKRLFIEFDKIERDYDDKNCYKVTGETTVFNGATRKFSGNFILKEQYVFNNDQLVSEEEFDISGQVHGFSILNFRLSENRKLSSTGIFEGIVLVRWYKDKAGKYQYDDFLFYKPRYANLIFLGTWQSFKTGNRSAVAWSHFRIPCSGDLDWGAGYFSPNPKYYQYGWEDYKP